MRREFPLEILAEQQNQVNDMAATNQVFDWIDDENNTICDIEDDHSTSTKAPLILITDHPDAAVESSSALSLQVSNLHEHLCLSVCLSVCITYSSSTLSSTS